MYKLVIEKSKNKSDCEVLQLIYSLIKYHFREEFNNHHWNIELNFDEVTLNNIQVYQRLDIESFLTDLLIIYKIEEV